MSLEFLPPCFLLPAATAFLLRSALVLALQLLPLQAGLP